MTTIYQNLYDDRPINSEIIFLKLNKDEELVPVLSKHSFTLQDFLKQAMNLNINIDKVEVYFEFSQSGELSRISFKNEALLEKSLSKEKESFIDFSIQLPEESDTIILIKLKKINDLGKADIDRQKFDFSISSPEDDLKYDKFNLGKTGIALDFNNRSELINLELF